MNRPIVSLLLLASAPAFTGEATIPAVDRLVACAEVQNPSQRLACFDREVAPLAKAKSPGNTARAPGTSTPAPPAAVAAVPAPKPSLGDEQLKSKAKPREEAKAEADEQAVHAHIASIRKVSTNTFVVSLDNGQAWRHEDVSLGEYLRNGEAITIRKGTLGSYRMTRDAGDSKNWIRVTRIR
jgi:hypothetical protein